jgi:two-component system CheB/CheR fusion protein
MGRIFSAGQDGLPPRVLASGKPLWIDDISKESNLPRSLTARESGIRAAFLFPLSATGKINGVIELFSQAALSPDADMLRLVDAFGSQIGLYIQRKRTEEELRYQKEAAEAASQAKDRFLATLSHELRTPLTPVLMWACATSQLENLEPDFKEGLQMVCRNIEMEARLIEDLLDLTRIERGKLQLKFQPCSADTILRHALEIVGSQIGAKNLQVSLDLAATNHQIMADPIRVEQVFWNLLKNAQKFASAEGEIVVRSYDIGSDGLGFEISDSGPGIDPEVMPKLFTAFEQAPGSRQGLGLGLAICKAIVEMHGGKIAAANRSTGTGATFSVVWKTIAGGKEVLPAKTIMRTIPSRKLKILVVEDHAHTAAVMRTLLVRDGHDVLTASTVREALNILHTDKLDLLVSDLGLPDGNGLEVMRRLGEISDAKGIAVSGYGMDEDVERSGQAGFSVHLTKPINVLELKQAIQKLTDLAHH